MLGVGSFRKKTKLVGSRWLREGGMEADDDRSTRNVKSGKESMKSKKLHKMREEKIKEIS